MVMARLTTPTARARCWPRRSVWVATELGRTYLFTGFPWVLLGYSQATRAADRAARQRLRRVRRVGAGRHRQRGAGVCGGGDDWLARCGAADAPIRTAVCRWRLRSCSSR